MLAIFASFCSPCATPLPRATTALVSNVVCASRTLSNAADVRTKPRSPTGSARGIPRKCFIIVDHKVDCARISLFNPDRLSHIVCAAAKVHGIGLSPDGFAQWFLAQTNMSSRDPSSCERRDPHSCFWTRRLTRSVCKARKLQFRSGSLCNFMRQ